MAKQIKKIKNPSFDQPLTAELIGMLIKARRTQSALRLEDGASLCREHTLFTFNREYSFLYCISHLK